MEPKEVDERELHFLVLHYLSSHVDSGLLRSLEESFLRRDALPSRLDWQGERSALSLDELKARYSNVSSDRLRELVARAGVEPLAASTFLPSRASALPSSAQSRVYEADNKIASRSHLLEITSIASRGGESLNSALLLREIQDRAVALPISLPVSVAYPFRKLKSIQGHRLPIYCVAFDRTGHRIFTGSDDTHIKVWSSITGQLLQSLRGHSAEITDMSIDESNKLLATASNDDTVRLWDVASLRPRGILINHLHSITAVLFCPDPDSQYLLTTTMGGTARVWSVGIANPPPPRLFECGSPIWCATWSPGGQRFATGCGDGTARIWSVDPPTLIQSLEDHRAVPVDSIKWSNQGSQLLTGSQDGTGCIWDYSEAARKWLCKATVVADGGALPSLPNNPRARDSVKCTMAAWSRDDRYAVFAFSNSQIRVFDMVLGEVRFTFREHTKEIFVIVSHPHDPRIIMSAGYDGKVCLWDLSSGSLVSVFAEGSSKISDGQISPCGHFIALADKDGFFSLYSTSDSALVSDVPSAQFLSTDDNALKRDPSGYVIDEVFSLPPHMIPRESVQLCNQFMEPYMDQPSGVCLEDSSPLDSASIQTMISRRRALRILEQTTFASFADPVVSESLTQPSHRLGRNRATSRARRGAATELTGALIQVDDEEMVENDLMDFLPSSQSSSSDDSESSDGLIDFANTPERSQRAPSRRVSRRVPERRAPNEAADEEAPIPRETDLESGVSHDEILTRSGRRVFEEDVRRSQRQSQRHATAEARPVRTRNRANPQRSEDTSLAYKMKHKLRVHLKKYGNNLMQYPKWLTSTYPLSEATGSYIPQFGDDVVFFTSTGYKVYSDEFLEFRDPSYGAADRVSPALPSFVRCTVVSVRYELEPFLHCSLELQVAATQFQLAELMAPSLSPEKLALVQRSDEARAWQLSSMTANEKTLSFRYHPSDLPDFLVLSSRFRHSLSLPWAHGQRFRMLFEGEDGNDEVLWHEGNVEALDVGANFPWECLQVRWDSAKHLEYVSPWEVLPFTAGQAPRHAALESLHPTVAQGILQRIEAEVSTLPIAVPFLQPVDLNLARGYSTSIAFPIDITTIASRLRNGYYRSVAHLRHDRFERFEVSALAKNVRNFDQRNLALSKDGFTISRLILGVIDEVTRDRSAAARDPGELLADLFAEDDVAAADDQPRPLIAFAPPPLDPRLASAKVSLPVESDQSGDDSESGNSSGSQPSDEFESKDLEDEDEDNLASNSLRLRSLRPTSIDLSTDAPPRRSTRLSQQTHLHEEEDGEDRRDAPSQEHPTLSTQGLILKIRPPPRIANELSGEVGEKPSSASDVGDNDDESPESESSFEIPRRATRKRARSESEDRASLEQRSPAKKQRRSRIGERSEDSYEEGGRRRPMQQSRSRVPSRRSTSRKPNRPANSSDDYEA